MYNRLKDINIDEFKRLYESKSKKEIQEKLNISDHTFYTLVKKTRPQKTRRF